MLASEGINNSGSYRFADYIYDGNPRSRNVIGRVLDKFFLGIESARAMRSRYVYSKQELVSSILRAYEQRKQIDILAVPCGLARELFEIADELEARAPDVLRFVRFHGIDLDRHLIDILQERANQSRAPMRFTVGDALDDSVYYQNFDVILSTGFTEYLPDHLVNAFFEVVQEHLKPDGLFVTCGMHAHRKTRHIVDGLAATHVTFRKSNEIKELALASGLQVLSLYHDTTGLQTMLVTRATGKVNRQGRPALPTSEVMPQPPRTPIVIPDSRPSRRTHYRVSEIT